LQRNFVDVFCGRSQDALMPTPPEEENRPAAKKIEDVMTSEELNATGLSKLSPVELQMLNAWLETNSGKLAPGPIDH
jgi:DNA replication protein DnaD